MLDTSIRHKEARLSIRTNADQKTILAQAARVQHMNVSQFVLQASLLAAAEIIKTETQLTIPSAEYTWLATMLDEPAPAPRLTAALGQTPVWNG